MLTADREMLERAWGLATLPMANTHYTQAVLQFLRQSGNSVCPRALQMFELATEVHLMRGTCESLLTAWMRPRRAVTAPMTPRAIRAA